MFSVFSVLRTMTIMLAILLASVALAKPTSGSPDGVQRFVIKFRDPPLAAYEGKNLPSAAIMSTGKQLQATSPRVTGARRLDARSPASQAYLQHLQTTHDAFRQEASVVLGRTIKPVNIYRGALNGMAVDLTAAEAAALAKSPFVKSVSKDTRHHLDTDAGPKWLGAAQIWNGESDFPASRGEGIVIGVIDSGINWDHLSFADVSTDGYHFVNPYPSQLGLCSDPEVMCNNKLVGVYDFVEDDPSTDDVVEENNKGKDNSPPGHGSHVAGIAAGNPRNTMLGDVAVNISGVAPRANIITYRVCYAGEPPDPDGGGCLGSAILSAIDQATLDGVDVINYSIGTQAGSPWFDSISEAYLNARNAGIFVVASAGNEGPNPATVGSPAFAPWVMAAGSASHDRFISTIVQNLSGGATAPPGDLAGASFTGGTTVRKIVHAKDFGNALCGTGAAELQGSCQANTGASNPWKGSKPFNGEIVVCDRGIYGRVEKGKNLLLAGAGGYILANTDEQGESIVSDDHCLATSHIGDQDGDKLRTWLATGSNHAGSISDVTVGYNASFADRVTSFSSRGPNQAPLQDILKPNVIAPGEAILSVSKIGQEFAILSGTSMASPHIAGSAALLIAVHPDWKVAQIVSALETTATAELATDFDFSIATPHERGAGRPQLGEAVNAGLYLDVSGAQFSSANPDSGGDPKNLNLSGLVDSNCQGSCGFTRTVTDQMGGGNWTATPMNFPSGAKVSISPSSFSLTNGASRALTINLASTGKVNEWVYGDILLSAAGSSDQALTAAVYHPTLWEITGQEDTGWREFELSGLAEMPDATFTSGGLVAPTRTTMTIKTDPTSIVLQLDKDRRSRLANEDPFDGGEGVFTVWHNLPQGGLWLHAETLASTATDLDLFVGRDDNGDGFASEDEQLCKSISPTDLEKCDLLNLPAGNYWVVVQNWEGTKAGGDEVTLISAAVDSSDHSNLVASGPGIIGEGVPFKVRTSWSDIGTPAGEQWYGAVGIGTHRESPNNLGVIPVKFNRNVVGATQTLPLMNGSSHKVALAGSGLHDRMFIDIPPGVTSMNVAAQGASSAQSNALKIELFRQDFSVALSSPPFAQLPAGLSSIAVAAGSGGNGPGITINDSVTAGRYFVKLSNTSGTPVSATVTATATSAPSTLNPHRGLWDADRNISQGAEWNASGSFNFSVWYTYDDLGQPTWYIAAGAAVTGNIWTADLLRVTNDGGEQQEKIVGKLSITFLADNQLIYSYTVLGQSGFDTMHPNGPNTCPNISGGPKSYTGHWYRGVAGLGGSTVLVYNSAQAQVHYLYDNKGEPRWVIAADDNNQSATAQVIPMLQFKGFCAVCNPTAVSWDTIGTVSRTFTSQTAGKWTLKFNLDSPLAQNINRTDNIEKLSDTLSCE